MFGLWLRRGVEETPVFREMEEKRETASTPIKEVLGSTGASCWSRALAHRLRCAHALVVVFTLTYVTTVLHLSRPWP